MFKRFNFALVNVIRKKIAVKKISSPPETYSHMCTFHKVRTFTFSGDLFTKTFQNSLKVTRKSVCCEMKKTMVLSRINDVKDIVLVCFFI